LESPPDILLSGINNGPNLGSELLYSGTVAAAMEGAFMGIPSIAVSHMYGPQRYFETAAEFISQLVHLFPKAHLSQRSLLNVNVPCLPIDAVAGVLMTDLGLRLYNDKFEKRTDPHGRHYYWLTGEAIDEGEPEGSDAWAILQNKISVTPIAFNMTDRISLKKLQGLTELTSLFSKNGGQKA
jgi:5'-nucleotidase